MHLRVAQPLSCAPGIMQEKEVEKIRVSGDCCNPMLIPHVQREGSWGHVIFQPHSMVRGRLTTDRDVVSGAIEGPHGHAGPTQAALIHVLSDLARQAGEAE